MSKPIKIVRVSGGYHLFVKNVPIVQDNAGKGVTFDRIAAGLKPVKGYAPPSEVNPFLIKTAKDVKQLAHQICRYVLNLGDMVYAHTELVGFKDTANWWG